MHSRSGHISGLVLCNHFGVFPVHGVRTPRRLSDGRPTVVSTMLLIFVDLECIFDNYLFNA